MMAEYEVYLDFSGSVRIKVGANHVKQAIDAAKKKIADLTGEELDILIKEKGTVYESHIDETGAWNATHQEHEDVEFSYTPEV